MPTNSAMDNAMFMYGSPHVRGVIRKSQPNRCFNCTHFKSCPTSAEIAMERVCFVLRVRNPYFPENVLARLGNVHMYITYRINVSSMHCTFACVDVTVERDWKLAYDT